MAIDTQFERKEDILIGKIDGRIDTINADELHNKLEAEMTAEDPALLLDFEKVSYISSSGLRVVLGMAKRFNEPGKRFAHFLSRSAIFSQSADLISLSRFMNLRPRQSATSRTVKLSLGMSIHQQNDIAEE